MGRWLPIFLLSIIGPAALRADAADSTVEYASEYEAEFVSEPDVAPAQYQAPAGSERRTSPSNDTIRQEYTSNTRTKSWESYKSRPSRVFGDLFFGGGTVSVQDFGGVSPLFGHATLPTAGGGGRLSVADNNTALPDDRVFLNYNHFQNAFEADISSGPTQQTWNVDRFTLGAEKTFWNDQASVQIQLPVTQGFTFSTSDFGVCGQSVGNLQAIVKTLVWTAPDFVVAAGLGLDLPTGSSVAGAIKTLDLHIQNNAVHLIPFVAYDWDVREWYSQGFVQVDVPTIGNQVQLNDGVPVFEDRLNEQALLRISEVFGVWIYRDETASGLTALATQVEFHYTGTLTDADQLSFGNYLGPYGLIQFSSGPHRANLLNLTAGITCEFANRAELRLGAGAPLRSGTDRTFDAELIGQFNWRF